MKKAFQLWIRFDDEGWRLVGIFDGIEAASSEIQEKYNTSDVRDYAIIKVKLCRPHFG